MNTSARPNEAGVLRSVIEMIRSRLPTQWAVVSVAQPLPVGRLRVDAVLEITGPDGAVARLVIECKQNLLARDALRAVTRARTIAESLAIDPANVIVVSPYLSPTTRESITELGASYADSTGNILLQSTRPAIFIATEGASKDPWPSDETLRSLKGRGAGRAVRAVVDFNPPYTLRTLGDRAGVPFGSLARVTDLLDRDGLITRGNRGPVTEVDWERVIRRWARDYDVARSNRVTTFLDPRGLPTLTENLSAIEGDYAATGAYAAQQFSPVAPNRLAAIYTTDVAATAERLGLVPTDAGANVWLIEPYDDVVFDRVAIRDGIRCVNPSQLAVDLLTGPGRDPAEGEELLVWMKGNEDAWRTR